VLDIDRFGNVRLNVRASHLVAAALAGGARAPRRHPERRSRCAPNQDVRGVEPGAYGVLVDAWNWMAVIRYEANAAGELGVQSGDPIWLTAG
jgi:S-adenosylmethionine hydrolase